TSAFPSLYSATVPICLGVLALITAVNLSAGSSGPTRRCRCHRTCRKPPRPSVHRIVVLIPEVQPARPWQRILHNQRGFVLDRAIQQGTDNVVICRLHFRRSIWSAQSST
ncbi:MAG TPA: hypothetical protein VF506_13485, partial [Streptosporangiaceae bacterium]